VTLAQNGLEAFELNKAKDFDMILMDVQMPVMDGVEATSIIREYEQSTGKHVPIIAVTANAMKGDKEKYIQCGMDSYMSKPIRRDELFKIIDKHLLENTEEKRATILVVEDYVPDQDNMIRVLNASGVCSFDVVFNAKDAFSRISSNQYDLIFADTDLPDFDGFELVKEIKKNGEQAKIVFTIYQPDEAKLAKVKELEGSDYIEKPIQEEAVLAYINNLGTTKIEEAEKTDSIIPAVGQDKPKPLDYVKALHEFDGDKEFLEDLLKNFICITRGQILEIGIAIKKDDAKAVKDISHSIKGGSANLCALPLSQIAAKLEIIGKSGILEDSQLIYEELEKELGDLWNFYEEVVAKGSR